MAAIEVRSVSELTLYIKRVFEGDNQLQNISVKGEVSNLTYHRSGHVYFSIKDAGAQLSCVMFKSFASMAPQMRQGDAVTIHGSLTVYPPRGNYQMMVRSVKKEEGLGTLYEKFLALKAKLEKEGLFDPYAKQAIPQFPQKIVVLTSPTGAAIKDILRTIKRRYPVLKVFVIPTVVQGLHGKDSIIRGLQWADTLKADSIILGRGGGSIEDLWNFNEEDVARAIAQTQTPVITGIGHETDVTIADMVADKRASTPTAAAEQAVPDLASITYTLSEYKKQLDNGLQYFIDFKRQVLDDYANRLQSSVSQVIQNRRHQLQVWQTQLEGMDMRKLLERGYTLTLKNQKILKGSEGLKEEDVIETVFHQGRIASIIKEVKS